MTETETVQQIIAHCEQPSILRPGLAYGEDSRALSNAVKAALKAKGYNVKSVRAIYHRGYRGIRVVIPHGKLNWPDWCDTVRKPASEILEELLTDKVPFEVVGR